MSRYFYLKELDDGGNLIGYYSDEDTLTDDRSQAALYSDQNPPSWEDWIEYIEREYLPEYQQNKLNGHPPLFVIEKDRMMPATLDQKVKHILENIEAARTRLKEVQDQIDYVNRVGRYPAKARESWQTRKDSPYKYLFMVFRSDGNGAYQGPDGKRKVYVGSEVDEESIYDARRLNSNFTAWTKLKAVERQIANWILGREHEVRELERLANSALERSAKIPTIPDDVYIHTPKKLPSLEKVA